MQGRFALREKTRGEGFDVARPIGLLVAMLASVVLVVPGSAAARLSCGSVINKDTTLHHDLDCHTRFGLSIGADGVTLNLNGYAIKGGPDVSEPQALNSAGIKNAGYGGATIKNGKVVGSVSAQHPMPLRAECC